MTDHPFYTNTWSDSSFLACKINDLLRLSTRLLMATEWLLESVVVAFPVATLPDGASAAAQQAALAVSNIATEGLMTTGWLAPVFPLAANESSRIHGVGIAYFGLGCASGPGLRWFRSCCHHKRADLQAIRMSRAELR